MRDTTERMQHLTYKLNEVMLHASRLLPLLTIDTNNLLRYDPDKSQIIGQINIKSTRYSSNYIYLTPSDLLDCPLDTMVAWCLDSYPLDGDCPDFQDKIRQNIVSVLSNHDDELDIHARLADTGSVRENSNTFVDEDLFDHWLRLLAYDDDEYQAYLQQLCDYIDHAFTDQINHVICQIYNKNHQRVANLGQKIPFEKINHYLQVKRALFNLVHCYHDVDDQSAFPLTRYLIYRKHLTPIVTKAWNYLDRYQDPDCPFNPTSFITDEIEPNL